MKVKNIRSFVDAQLPNVPCQPTDASKKNGVSIFNRFAEITKESNLDSFTLKIQEKDIDDSTVV